MTITMLLMWWERNADFSPDFDKRHEGRIKGQTPAEIMMQLNEIRNNHDLAKYTKIEIVGIY